MLFGTKTLHHVTQSTDDDQVPEAERVDPIGASQQFREEQLAELALLKYEMFHGPPPEPATMAQVRNSCAGTMGWAHASLKVNPFTKAFLAVLLCASEPLAIGVLDWSRVEVGKAQIGRAHV